MISCDYMKASKPTSLALFMLFRPYLIALQHAVFDSLTTCYHPASSIAETVYQYCTVNVVKVSVHACANQDMELGAPIQACSCAELLIVYKVASLLHAPPLHLHKFSAGKLLVAFTLVQSTTVLSSMPPYLCFRGLIFLMHGSTVAPCTSSLMQ